MIIYFYHTRPVQEAYQEWKEGVHPGHILYGITEFENYDIKTIFHKGKFFNNRFKFALNNAKQILFCKKEYDILYGTHSLGLEIIILLKILHLYNKPIVIWQHRKVHRSKNLLLNYFYKKFYEVIDSLFFFTKIHIDESIQSGNITADKCNVVKWGPDLKFYDKLKNDIIIDKNEQFISTGKENRDFQTLINAFSQNNTPLEIYLPEVNGDRHYVNELKNLNQLTENVKIKVVDGIIPHFLALRVASSFAVTVCCTDQNYTVGLTTLVEALALGIPVIITRNKYLSIDVEYNKCGLAVDANDVEGWINAVNLLCTNREAAKIMGENGRKLVENEYNLCFFSSQIVNTFRQIVHKN